ncbi:50S ribosomal protein L6 [Candidatus Roizmanbacteria bacterium]|nr:50S ribosomal protein L6 [Candidatus Roizmanbacteria bacterium]
MSKIGEKSIQIPKSIQVDISQNSVKVKGKEGEISHTLPEVLKVQKEGEALMVKRSNNEKKTKSLHGLFRELLSNAVKGVESPWEKKLEVVGTGFNVKLQGEDLVFKVGFSHPVTFKKVSGTKFKVEGNNKVLVSGIDKQLVGQVAYQIKMLKKPDAYKGKGIRYLGEKIRIKPGKKAKTVTAGATPV